MPIPKPKDTILTEEQWESVRRLSTLEQEIARDYYRNDLTQAQIGLRHGMTQAAVSTRLSKINERLEWVQHLPPIPTSDLTELLTPEFNSSTPILTTLYETTCQSETAVRMGCSQGKVRHQLHKAVDKLETLVESGRTDLEEVLRGLRTIRDRDGTLHTFDHPSRRVDEINP